jgi:23S rRNA (uracil1939-C5)-methyltransferase
VVSVVHGLRTTRDRLAQPQRIVKTYGAERITERLAGLDFALSAESFFQTNTRAAELLFAQVADLAALTGNETVVDAYAGVGAITLVLAGKARNVTAIESSTRAVADGKAIAAANGIGNVRFLAGDAGRILGSDELERPDVLVLDPPRAGMSPGVVDSILRMKPERIVAVSCDPATFARDVKRLAPAYALQEVRPVDLFPHSHHVETAALLTRG